MIYETKDLIIPMLTFPDPCPVRIEDDGKYIFLYVGQRDWQWDKATGRFVGAGTSMCGSVKKKNAPGDPTEGA